VFCSTCGNKLVAGARFCPKCGSEVGTSGPAPGSGVPSVPYQFDLARWGLGDRIVLGATAVAFVALFLPWYSFYGLTTGVLAVHGWMYLALIVMLGIIAYLIVRALGLTFLNQQIPHWIVLACATGFCALLTLITFLWIPSGFTLSWGAFVGLLSVLTATVGSIYEGGLIRVRPGGYQGASAFSQAGGSPSVGSPLESMPHPSPNQGWSEDVVAGDPAQSMVTCSSCSQTNPGFALFCRGCGQGLVPPEE
jgi:ribosomal protein L40E